MKLNDLIVSILLLCGMLLANCGGSGQTVSVRAEASNVESSIRQALEYIEVGETQLALDEITRVQLNNPTYETNFLIGLVKFLDGDYTDTINASRAYIQHSVHVSEQDAEEVQAEISRLELAIEGGSVPTGASLANSRLRGYLAEMRAYEAVSSGDFELAHDQYFKASQYLPNKKLVYEAALAAIKAERYHEANKLLRIYIANSPDLSRDTAYKIQAELERIGAIISGKEPATRGNLADSEYEERGSETAESWIFAQCPIQSSSPNTGTNRPKETPVSTASGYKQIKKPSDDSNATRQKGSGKYEPQQATVEELIEYSQTGNSTVRHQAVRDLTRLADDRARLALEQAVLNDSNLDVRLVAIVALVVRRSTSSLPVLRQALITSSNSEERARLRDSIEIISLGVGGFKKRGYKVLQ